MQNVWVNTEQRSKVVAEEKNIFDCFYTDIFFYTDRIYFFTDRTDDKDQLAALQQKIDDYWFWNFENNAIRAVGGNPCDIDSDYI